jgi:hypothetical protein
MKRIVAVYDDAAHETVDQTILKFAGQGVVMLSDIINERNKNT